VYVLETKGAFKMNKVEELQKKDLQYIWHPCSQMKDYEELPPIIVKKGDGVFIEDIEGKRYLDAVSSWWVNLFGHSNKRINDALYKQANQLEHVIFANFSHEPAIELCERLMKLVPKGLGKVFFADNGSSSIEVALKISFQYHYQTGKEKKKKFVALTDAYHGETIGALSMGGCDRYSQIFKPLLLDVKRVYSPDCYRCKYEKCRDNCDAECFEHMEETIKENHEEISAVIIEPMVQGAGGIKIYSPKYLKKLRHLCDEYDINLIADEIAMGMGRTGKMFACEHAGITPDLMTVSKGITAGYLPLALTIMTDKIYDAFYDDYRAGRSFIHSHSYSGNALACSVALETLKIFEEDKVLQKNEEKSKVLRRIAEEKLLDIPQVGEYRQIGMVGAVELVKDKESKERFPWDERVGYEIYKIALKKGVLIRPMGDVVYFMPPYVINEEEIEFMIDVARESILEYFENR
jgi:adenosylmethionine-8-amino-7-oxononanoate aminotransferase